MQNHFNLAGNIIYKAMTHTVLYVNYL